MIYTENYCEGKGKKQKEMKNENKIWGFELNNFYFPRLFSNFIPLL